MSADASDNKPKSAGIPAWMATFADLMALMMTFFVLLYAYSEVETEKFKAVAGSLANALGGVQYIKSNSEDNVKGMEAGVVSRTGTMTIVKDDRPTQTSTAQRVEELKQKLEKGLKEEIEAGKVMVKKEGDEVVIRFPEHVSFPSGSATLVQGAAALIRRIVEIVADEDKYLTVAGHTDDIPLKGGRFNSNWDLSASRAVAVAEQVLTDKTIDPSNLSVAGYAETRPLVPNDNAENRAKNRRVEIIVRHKADIPALPSKAIEVGDAGAQALP